MVAPLAILLSLLTWIIALFYALRIPQGFRQWLRYFTPALLICFVGMGGIIYFFERYIFHIVGLILLANTIVFFLWGAFALIRLYKRKNTLQDTANDDLLDN